MDDGGDEINVKDRINVDEMKDDRNPEETESPQLSHCVVPVRSTSHTGLAGGGGVRWGWVG